MSATDSQEKKRALIAQGGSIHAVVDFGPVPTDDAIWCLTDCGRWLSANEGMAYWANLMSATCGQCVTTHAIKTHDLWATRFEDDHYPVHAVKYDDEVEALCGDPLFGYKWHVLDTRKDQVVKNQVLREAITCVRCQIKVANLLNLEQPEPPPLPTVTIELPIDEVLAAAVFAEAFEGGEREKMFLDPALMRAKIIDYVHWGIDTRLDATRENFDMDEFQTLASLWVKGQQR